MRAMLAHVGIIAADDAERSRTGWTRSCAKSRPARFAFSDELEDIHMNVEARLTELIGAAAGRLHTARSRNDQVALDFRLWVRDAIDGLRVAEALQDLIAALLDRAEEHAATRHAGLHPPAAGPAGDLRPPPAGLCRDVRRATVARLRDARERMNESPLGAAALAGTGFPIDRHMTAQALGFDRPTRNSLDAVSDRDFAAGVPVRRAPSAPRTCRASPRRS